MLLPNAFLAGQPLHKILMVPLWSAWLVLKMRHHMSTPFPKGLHQQTLEDAAVMSGTQESGMQVSADHHVCYGGSEGAP